MHECDSILKANILLEF